MWEHGLLLLFLDIIKILSLPGAGRVQLIMLSVLMEGTDL